MSRLQATFTQLKHRHEKGLVAFITAGDPSLKHTKDYCAALEAGGVDVIELGVPFSDPMADGPVIQAADERALDKGTTLEKILECVASIRRHSDIPLVLMGYYNPIYAYGLKRFARDAAELGLDGCLVADLPVEEAMEVQTPLAKAKLDLIYLMAPTSDGPRLKRISKRASGYLYYVSMTGITGGQARWTCIN